MYRQDKGNGGPAHLRRYINRALGSKVQCSFLDPAVPGVRIGAVPSG